MNKLLNKMGYVSIEVVVVVSIILVGGTIGIAKYTSKGKETTNKTTTTVAKVYKDYGSDTTTPTGSGTNGGSSNGGTVSRPEGTYLNTVKVRYEDEYGEYSNYFTVKEEYLKPNETFTWSSQALNWNDEEKEMYQIPTDISYKSPSEDKETKIDIKRELVTLDLNGSLDTTTTAGPNTTSWGTFDVYVNGKKIASDISDYCTDHKYGAHFKITNIKAKNGFAFVKEYNRNSLEGTLYNQIKMPAGYGAKYKTEVYLVFKKI